MVQCLRDRPISNRVVFLALTTVHARSPPIAKGTRTGEIATGPIWALTGEQGALT